MYNAKMFCLKVGFFLLLNSLLNASFAIADVVIHIGSQLNFNANVMISIEPDKIESASDKSVLLNEIQNASTETTITVPANQHGFSNIKLPKGEYKLTIKVMGLRGKEFVEEYQVKYDKDNNNSRYILYQGEYNGKVVIAQDISGACKYCLDACLICLHCVVL